MGKRIPLSAVLLSMLCASRAGAQGPASETAPPLFPGGGLVSYNSVFTARGPMPGASGNIPVTAFPTFSHEGEFNFTWGFRRDWDLTVVVPVVTSRFNVRRANGRGYRAR